MTKREKKKCYEAAKRIIQEESLVRALQNPAGQGEEQMNMSRTMLALKVLGEKNKIFVFDPAKGVRIGRRTDRNEISLQDMLVSGEHCRISVWQGRLCIEDRQSANGTVIKKKWKRERILYGDADLLDTGDKIRVGNTWFQIRLFYCDLITG